MPFLQIRTQRTVPLICGTVKRFLLFGDHDGDVFATGGEMEIVQACDVIIIASVFTTLL